MKVLLPPTALLGSTALARAADTKHVIIAAAASTPRPNSNAVDHEVPAGSGLSGKGTGTSRPPYPTASTAR
jgi:hypothetical protein